MTSNHDWVDTPEGWNSRKFLIIGQAPARSSTPDTRPWDSASGRRLATYMGVHHGMLMDHFDTTNLNRGLHETKGKWDAFDRPEAEHRAELLEQHLHQWKGVLICGKMTAKFMGFPLLEYNWHGSKTQVLAIPHPGGTNLWYNEPVNRDRVINYLSRIRTEWLP